MRVLTHSRGALGGAAMHFVGVYRGRLPGLPCGGIADPGPHAKHSRLERARFPSRSRRLGISGTEAWPAHEDAQDLPRRPRSVRAPRPERERPAAPEPQHQRRGREPVVPRLPPDELQHRREHARHVLLPRRRRHGERRALRVRLPLARERESVHRCLPAGHQQHLGIEQLGLSGRLPRRDRRGGVHVRDDRRRGRRLQRRLEAGLRGGLLPRREHRLRLRRVPAGPRRRDRARGREHVGVDAERCELDDPGRLHPHPGHERLLRAVQRERLQHLDRCAERSLRQPERRRRPAHGREPRRQRHSLHLGPRTGLPRPPAHRPPGRRARRSVGLLTGPAVDLGLRLAVRTRRRHRMLGPDDVLPGLPERQRIRGADRLERIDERVRQRSDPPHRRREPGPPRHLLLRRRSDLPPVRRGLPVRRREPLPAARGVLRFGRLRRVHARPR